MPREGEEWITRPVASHSRRGIENEQKYREPFKAHLSSRRRSRFVVGKAVLSTRGLEGSLQGEQTRVSNFSDPPRFVRSRKIEKRDVLYGSFSLSIAIEIAMERKERDKEIIVLYHAASMRETNMNDRKKFRES